MFKTNEQRNDWREAAAAQDDADFLVVGAGIAGAGVAYWLSRHGRVVVLERESQPGYHSTGRSAALFMASYGNAQVRALSHASRAFFDEPPQGFTDYPLLSSRGALMVASQDQMPQLNAHWHNLESTNPLAQRLSKDEALGLVPLLKPEAVEAALMEPDAADIDVNGLLQGFLKGSRRNGGAVLPNTEVRALSHTGQNWQIITKTGAITAKVVVNAAGAWCDQVAVLAGGLPLGLQPKRRSAFMFEVPGGYDISKLPMVYGADEGWYIKPDAGFLLGSPANADDCQPQDVQPEEFDIAVGVHRIEEAINVQIRRPLHPWAGLRTFSPDGGLIGGYDDVLPDFFWVAAQGGYGIQTAPAMSEACAALIRRIPIPEHLARHGITEQILGVQRFKQ